MNELQFEFPEVTLPFKFSESFVNALKIEDKPDIVLWIEKNIRLPQSSTYALKGPVKLDPFQKWPLRQAVKPNTKKFVIVSSVQTSKTFMMELISYYTLRFRNGNMMMCYQTETNAASQIQERITPTIKANKELKRYLTKDLSKNKLQLQHGVVRIASSEAPNSTIASFSVPYIFGSEVAKYFSKEYDIIQLLLGRKNFYEKTGEWGFYAESSPLYSDDCFGKLCDSVQLHVYPHVKLPCCGGWLFLEDSHLEVINDENGEPIRNIEFIKNNKHSVFLRCPYCNAKIPHHNHYDLLQNVIYATSPDEIINDQQPDYDNFTEIVIHWNKLLNQGYTFNNCIADFFHAKNQLDGGIALNTYQRETMGRFIKRGEVGQDQPTISINLNKYQPYTIFTPSKLPNDIQFMIVGHDMHHDRITSIVRGFTGKNTDTYLIDYQEIPLNILEDPKDVFEKVRDSIYLKEYITEDNRKLPILRSIVDIADGNTKKFAEYMTDRITFNGHKIMKPYRGSTQRNKPLIEWHDKSKCYFGDTQALSKIVGQLIENNNWYLPSDCPESYLKQLMGENIDGKKISENNHTRSCENYIQAMAYLLESYKPSGKWFEEMHRINNPAVKKTIGEQLKASQKVFKPSWWG